jgi:alcohol dehydrogenase
MDKNLESVLHQLNLPGRFLIGRDLQAELQNALSNISSGELLVVTQKEAYEFSGAQELLGDFLDSLEPRWFTDFSPNPKWEELAEEAAWLNQNPVKCILALGGGSAMDSAKCLKGLSSHWDDAESYIRGEKKIAGSRPQLIAVPTTSGTGSEATHFAVIYLEGKKYSLAHPSLLPDMAFVDAVLTDQMPPALTASTGLDALCQGIESWWATQSTQESRAFSEIAIRLAWSHLESATLHPTPTDRLAMACASHAAGRAINITKTTAPHALSYTLTSKWGIPHGNAVSIFLPAIWEFNSRATQLDLSEPLELESFHAGMQELLRITGFTSAQSASEAFGKLVDQLGLPFRLNQITEVTPEVIDILSQSVNAERLNNNPRRLNEETLRMIVAAS